MYIFTGTHEGFTLWTEATQDSLRRSPPPLYPTMTRPGWLHRIRPVYRELHYWAMALARTYTARTVRRAMVSLRPNLVHAQWLRQDSIMAAAFRDYPRVLTVWGSDIRQLHQLPRLYRAQIRRALGDADAVTGGSRDLLHLCQLNGAAPDHCHLIGVPGIPLAHFSVAATTAFHKRLGIPPTHKIILSCRAVRRLYRIDFIIRAFALLRHTSPAAVLVILRFHEDPEYFKELTELVRTLGLQQSIRFVSSLPYSELPHAYADSAVMISVPQHDGLPQSVYEAFAARCPVITSDLATYDGVLDHESSGLRVGSANPKELAAAITRLLTDAQLRERLVTRSRAIVETRGDIHREMKKLETLYYSLLK